MDKLKIFGLNLLSIVMLIITVPMIILWAIAFCIMYACFSAFEYITWEYNDDGINEAWSVVTEIYAKICDQWKELILDLKTEL